MKPEALIQNEIRCALSKYGLVVRQNVGNFYNEHGTRTQCGFKGLSDLIYFGKDGTVAFMEIKNEKGRPSDHQIKFLTLMRSYGFKADICRSVDDALKLIGRDK
jgi:hypothetical protein